MPEDSAIGGVAGIEGEDGGDLDAPLGAPGPEAATLALQAAAQPNNLPREALEYFRLQSRLIAIQTEHLHEQRALTLSHLRLRLVGDWFRTVAQFAISAIGVLALLLLLVVIVDAFTSQAVVVDRFTTPAALVANGLSGEVVAAGLLDKLNLLQDATRTNLAARVLSDAWSHDIKIELPETGISLGEVDRLIRARFGHDLHIGGDLIVSKSGGLALTVRGDGVPPRVFAGSGDDIDKLTTEAAEYIYGKAEPSRFATYLNNSARYADAIAFCQSMLHVAAVAERPYLLYAWAVAVDTSGSSIIEALRLYRAALDLKPDYWENYAGIIAAMETAGDEEGAWQAGNAFQKAAGARPGRAPEVLYVPWDWLTWNLQAERAASVADAQRYGGFGTWTAAQGPQIADIDWRLHDPEDAERQLQSTVPDSADPTITAMSHFVRGQLAAEAGDTSKALAELEAFGVAYADPIVKATETGYNCWLAPLEEKAGHPERADSILKTAGSFVDCYRFQADILDHRGDWTGAQRAYQRAVALAPDLPAAYYSWGLALARHNDVLGAIANFAAAYRHGPHWADPLKAWGDVLFHQNDWAGSLDKYDAALTYAPAWAELRRARAEAAKKAKLAEP